MNCEKCGDETGQIFWCSQWVCLACLMQIANMSKPNSREREWIVGEMLIARTIWDDRHQGD